MRVTVPATTRQPETVVEIDDDGFVLLDGANIGRVSGDGSYRYSPRAAGHSGRIARYHTSVREWQAWLPGRSLLDGPDFKGGAYPSHYRKNTRKGALAFLVGVANGENPSEAGYFVWTRDGVIAWRR